MPQVSTRPQLRKKCRSGAKTTKITPASGKAPVDPESDSRGSIREREERYALILAGANDGLWDWDLRTGNVYRSARVMEILGFDAAARDFSPEEWGQRIHADDRGRYQESLVQYLKGMTDRLERQYRVMDATGAYRWVMEHAKGVRDERNRVYRIAGSLRDITQQVEAQEALKRSEQRFRGIAEIASDRIWEVDSGFRFTMFSSTGLDGVRAENALGKTPWEVFDVDPAEDAQWGQLKALFEAHHPFRNYLRSGRYSLGRTEYYRISGAPIFDEKGDFAGYYGVTTIETKTIIALERARQAEELLRNAIEAISEGFAIYDKDERFVMCNRAYENIYPESAEHRLPGAKFETILRDGLAKGQYADAVGREEAWLESRLRYHRDAAGAVEQRLKDGRQILVTERRMPNGGTASLRLDITALKQAEEALRESKNLLQATFEAVSEGIAVFDGALRIVALNPNLFSLLGIEPQGLKTGDQAESLIRLCYSVLDQPGDPLEHYIEEDLARLRKPEPRVAECDLRDGRVLEIHDNPLSGGGMVRTYRDITAHRRVEEALRAAALQAQRANEAKSEFLANMSHELRTPLNAIIGFSELMRDGLFGPLGNDRYQTYSRDIHQSGCHLLSVINGILDLAKIESGRQHLVEQDIDASAVISETVDALRLQAKQAKIAVTVETPPSPVSLFADETKFRQILMNLVSNAVKFTPAGGSVMVSYTVNSEGGFVLKVTDTGIGMAPDEIPVALEPFRQLDGHQNRKYPGTGLGLPLTKRLVELHGGTFTIHSSRGQGTVVTATFPAKRGMIIRP